MGVSALPSSSHIASYSTYIFKVSTIDGYSTFEMTSTSGEKLVV